MTRTARPTLPTILAIGALWGIFEATVGFALHMLPWRIGSYIWFPAAYFFMERAYNATGKRWAVGAVALISAGIKLLNLFSAARVDYVINPAVSILWESLAMVGVLTFAAHRGKEAVGPTIARVLAVNTLWRLMYSLYLLFLVPAWMREVSAIVSLEAYLPFILRENLLSALVCVLWLKVYGLIEGKLPRSPIFLQNQRTRYAAAGALLACGVLAQFLL